MTRREYLRSRSKIRARGEQPKRLEAGEVDRLGRRSWIRQRMGKVGGVCAHPPFRMVGVGESTGES